MIYTLTLNPAVDYVVFVDELVGGKILRSRSDMFFFGGKGINVSWILNELGIRSVAMGFLAGFTGKAIEEGLSDRGIGCDFVYPENGFTRINVKIRSDRETDINGKGPDITENEYTLLLEKLDCLCDGDVLIMAGSIPPTLPDDVYENIMKRLREKKIEFVVDAAGELMVNALKYRPFLIKPNMSELGEIFSRNLISVSDAVEYSAKLQKMGARNVLVSMGADGALLLDEYGKQHFMPAFPGKVVNTVGSGDSMVAGFVAGYSKTADFDYALKLGSAAGSATAFCEGLADMKLIYKCMEQED